MKFAKNMPKWLDRYSAVALRYVLACLSAAALFLTASPASAWKMEVGEFISNQTYDAIPSFNTISFDQAYDTPPIVFVLPTTNGGHTAALRVRDITTTQFEVGVTEPTGFDGPHVDMRVRYLAIEPGVHTLPDGTLHRGRDGRHDRAAGRRELPHHGLLGVDLVYGWIRRAAGAADASADDGQRVLERHRARSRLPFWPRRRAMSPPPAPTSRWSAARPPRVASPPRRRSATWP